MLLYFDIKLLNVGFRYRYAAGYSIADMITEHLFIAEEIMPTLYLVLSSCQENDADFVRGFYDLLEHKHLTDQLVDRIGWDLVYFNIQQEKDWRQVWEEAGFQNITNIWIGDGNKNCFGLQKPLYRLEKALSYRDVDNYGQLSIKKVYGWTVDIPKDFTILLE